MNAVPLRVLCVDDDVLVREVYRSLLTSQTDLGLVGEAHDGREAVKAYERLRPDVVLMDLQMPVMSGIEATREICSRWPRACIVALTTFGTRDYIVAALRAGASGYMLKDTDLKSLLVSIRQAVRGEMPLSSSVRRKLVSTLSTDRRTETSEELELTEREQDILVCLARGMTNQQMSRHLYMCERSVKQCLAQIGDKLGVTSRTQILVRSIQLGAVDPHVITLIAS